jgi:hypothetical protein
MQSIYLCFLPSPPLAGANQKLAMPQTDRQPDGQTDRRTDGQTDRWTDREAKRTQEKKKEKELSALNWVVCINISACGKCVHAWDSKMGSFPRTPHPKMGPSSTLHFLVINLCTIQSIRSHRIFIVKKRSLSPNNPFVLYLLPSVLLFPHRLLSNAIVLSHAFENAAAITRRLMKKKSMNMVVRSS